MLAIDNCTGCYYTVKYSQTLGWRCLQSSSESGEIHQVEVIYARRIRGFMQGGGGDLCNAEEVIYAMRRRGFISVVFRGFAIYKTFYSKKKSPPEMKVNCRALARRRRVFF